MPYLIEFEGASYNTDDLSINESVQIEKDTGLSWRYLSPLNSAQHWKAIVTAFVARDKGWDAARSYVDGVCSVPGSLNDAVESIKPVEDDRPTLYDDGIPKAEDDPSTSGSSGAPSDSDGPRIKSDA